MCNVAHYLIPVHPLLRIACFRDIAELSPRPRISHEVQRECRFVWIGTNKNPNMKKSTRFVFECIPDLGRTSKSIHAVVMKYNPVLMLHAILVGSQHLVLSRSVFTGASAGVSVTTTPLAPPSTCNASAHLLQATPPQQPLRAAEQISCVPH